MPTAKRPAMRSRGAIQPPCDVEGLRYALDVIGGKWKIVILWHLHGGMHRFGELRNATSGISEKMLVQELRDLERAGLILRTAYPEVPPRVEYRITAAGRRLRPALRALSRWGLDDGGVAARRQRSTA